MHISPRTLTASAIGAGLAVAATQNASISMTAPIPVSADLMKVLLPVTLALVPVLLQNFAPALLPFWEWLKGKLPLPAELAEYRRIVAAQAIRPDCPVWRQNLRDAIQGVFDKYHPAPPVPSSQSSLTQEVNNAQ